MGKNTNVERGSGKKGIQCSRSDASTDVAHLLTLCTRSFSLYRCENWRRLLIFLLKSAIRTEEARGALRQVRQRGRKGGESCERRDDLSAWNVNHWPQVIFCRVMLLWLTWLCNVPADANLKAWSVSFSAGANWRRWHGRININSTFPGLKVSSLVVESSGWWSLLLLRRYILVLFYHIM